MSGFVSEVCGVNKNGVVKILKKSSLKGEREQDTFEKIRDVSWIIGCTYYCAKRESGKREDEWGTSANSV
jgi:hypothetical protein